MTYYLAVDGGGTKCLAVLVHAEHGVVGSGRSGGTNPHSVGRERAAQALTEAVRAACRGLPAGERIHAAAFGLAGVDTPGAEEEARGLVREALDAAGVSVGDVFVENDGLVALRGAAEGGRGLLVIGGTGSVAWAGDGRRFVRAGGWGHKVGDHGSAYYIAQLALAAAFRSFDAGETDTPLIRHLCAAVQAPDLYRFYDWLYRPDTVVDSLAGLARAVDAAAQEGDPAAKAVLARAGWELAELAALAARKAGLVDGGSFPVFLMGGVLQHSAAVRAAMLERLAEQAPGGVVQVPRFAPIYGAVIRAMGGPEAVDEGLRQRLLATDVLLA
ncbi:MAG: hypothetical protein LOD90_04500 [Symbiobacteriaceae bacterium]|nr:MAG: hypothetical protein DIU55_11965 [Bacillota bacterium]